MITKFFFNASKQLSIQYFVDNFHYMAAFIVFDDDFATNIHMISVVAAIGGRVSSGYIFSKFGVDGCYILGFISAIFNSFLFLIFGLQSRVGFTFMTFYSRFFYASLILWGNMVLFSVYKTEESLKIAKFYDLYVVFAVVLDVIFNNIFVSNHHFYILFVAFMTLEVLGMLLYFTKRSEFLNIISKK